MIDSQLSSQTKEDYGSGVTQTMAPIPSHTALDLPVHDNASKDALLPPPDPPPNTNQNSPLKWRSRLEKWNREWLVLPKCIYFTLNCSIYATHNYTAMYFYKMWGLAIYQFGAVSALSAVQFLGALFWGHLADKTGRHKSILLACTVLYALFFCLLELKPFGSQASILTRIVYSAIMYGISCFFVSCLFPLVDAQIFSILAQDPNFTKETFGRQRLWGTVGHGIITLTVGAAIYTLGYFGMFAVLVTSCSLFVFFIVVGIPADIKIVKRPPPHQQQSSSTTETLKAQPINDNPKGMNTDLGNSPEHQPAIAGCWNRILQAPAIKVLLNPHFFFLAMVIFFAGYVRSVMSSFLGFYMQTEMHQSEIMVAIAIMFRMASEMAIFFYNKQLLRTIGLYWMLIIAQVAGLLRVLAYSLLPPTGNWFYFSFAIELLKGTSTGCLISSGVRMANDIAPKGCVNTAQSYISGIYSGLSLAVGGALGGLIIYLLPNHSVSGMFWVTFWIGLVALILCLLKYSLVDRAILVPKSWRRTPPPLGPSTVLSITR